MSKHEILITSDNNDLMVALFEFLNKQPEQKPCTTKVTILEDGTSELLDAVLNGANEIAVRRKERAANVLKQLYNLERIENSQEHPEDFNL